jgi:hypothetical protein
MMMQVVVEAAVTHNNNNRPAVGGEGGHEFGGHPQLIMTSLLSPTSCREYHVSPFQEGLVVTDSDLEGPRSMIQGAVKNRVATSTVNCPV